MQVRNNEIIVHRGETWTMSKRIQNRDGSPYIVSNQLINPHWLINVSNSKDSNFDNYVLNKWLSLSLFPRFYHTTPIRLADYKLTFEDKTLPFDNDIDGITDFTGDETSGYSDIAVFYEKDENGVISYKYWEYINNDKGDFAGKWVDYNCVITTVFPTELTKYWFEGSYTYEISLVDGPSTEGYLEALVDTFEINVPEAPLYLPYLENMYDAIKKVKPDLLENVDINRPMVIVGSSYPILSPTRLVVTSNLNGGNLQ